MRHWIAFGILICGLAVGSRASAYDSGDVSLKNVQFGSCTVRLGYSEPVGFPHLAIAALLYSTKTNEGPLAGGAKWSTFDGKTTAREAGASILVKDIAQCLNVPENAVTALEQTGATADSISAQTYMGFQFQLTAHGSDLTNGLYEYHLGPQKTNGLSNATLARANYAPTAKAGPDQTGVASAATVTLDGSASSDPDTGDTLTYEWTQTAGTSVTLSSATDVKPTFTAPSLGANDAAVTLTFSLVVTDNNSNKSTADTVSVTVNPLPLDVINQPSITFGSCGVTRFRATPQKMFAVSLDLVDNVQRLVGGAFWLNGVSKSNGLQAISAGDIASCLNITPDRVSELQQTGADANSYNEQVYMGFSFRLTDAPSLANGVYEYHVGPQKTNGLTNATLARANYAPTAKAGPDQAGVASAATVTLDGSASSDPDTGDTLTYEWTQTAGTSVTLSSATDVKPTFTAPSLGANDAAVTLTFSLVVTDNNSNKSTADTVSITLNPSAPVVSLVTQPVAGASDAVFPTQPVVQLQDGAGRIANLAASATVSATLRSVSGSGAGTLGGKSEIKVDPNTGKATFTDLTIKDATAGDVYRLSFASSVDGVETVISDEVTISGELSMGEGGTNFSVPGSAPVAGSAPPRLEIVLRDAAGRPLGADGSGPKAVTGVTFAILEGPKDAVLTVNPTGRSVTVPASGSGVYGVNVVAPTPGAVSVGATFNFADGTQQALPSPATFNFTPPSPQGQLIITRQPVAAGNAEPLAIHPIIELRDNAGQLVSSDSSTMVRMTGRGFNEGPTTKLSLNRNVDVVVQAKNGVVDFSATPLALEGTLGEQYEFVFTHEAVSAEYAPVVSEPVALTGAIDLILEEISDILEKDLKDTIEDQQERFNDISAGALARLQTGEDRDLHCGDIVDSAVDGSAEANGRTAQAAGNWGGHVFDCTTNTHIITNGEFEVGYTQEKNLTFDLNATRQFERFIDEDRVTGLFFGGYAKRDAVATPTANGTVDGIGVNSGVFGAMRLNEKAYLDYYAAGAAGYHRFDLNFQRPNTKDIPADGHYTYWAVFAGAALSGEIEYDGFTLKPRSGVELAYARSSDADVAAFGGIEHGKADIPDYRGIRVYVTPTFEFARSIQGQSLNEIQLMTAVSPTVECRRYSRDGASNCDPSLRIEFSRLDTGSQALLGLDMEYVFEDEEDSWDVSLDVTQPMFNDTSELSFGIGRDNTGTSKLHFNFGAQF